MPRTQVAPKPKRTVEVVRRPLADEVEPDEELQGDDYELLSAANELAGQDGASVTIYRQGLHGRDLRFIDTMPPGNFSMVMLKHPPYSGGKFRIQMRNVAGELVMNRMQEVEPAPKAPEVAPLPAPTPAPPPNNNAEAFVLLAKAMTDGFSRLGELIVASRHEPPKPRSTEEILNELTLMKSLFDRPATDPIDTFTKLLGVVKELPGRDGGAETSPLDVLLELAKQFGPKLMEAHEMATGAAAPPRLRAPLAQQPPVQRPAVVVNPEGRKPDVNIIVSQQLKFLVRQAQRNNDPEPYAVMVLDNVPPPILDSFLKRPDWFEEICKYVPDAQPHREWFTALKAIIDDYLTDDGEGEQTAGEPATDGPATDGTAATGNGKPDTPNT